MAMYINRENGHRVDISYTYWDDIRKDLVDSTEDIIDVPEYEEIEVEETLYYLLDVGDEDIEHNRELLVYDCSTNFLVFHKFWDKNE